MKKINTLILVLLALVVATTTVIVSAQQKGKGARTRDIGISVEDDFMDDDRNIDVSVIVKEDGDRYFEPVSLDYDEDTRFYDMPTYLNKNDKFKIMVRSNVEDDLYLYLLNVTPENELVNVFQEYELYFDGKLIEGNTEVEIPKGRVAFTFNNETGTDILLLVSSKRQMYDEDINQVFEIKEDYTESDDTEGYYSEDGSGARSRDIGIVKDESVEDVVIENEIEIYGAYFYSMDTSGEWD